MTNEILDIRSVASSTKDGRCLEVWFARNVTDDDRANLLAAVNALRAQSDVRAPAPQGEPGYSEQQVHDAVAKVISGMLSKGEIISPADLAEVLENVRAAIAKLSDFRSVKNVPIELHKACLALTHIVEGAGK